MGKSKKGGVYGFLRGRVGSVSYSVLSAKRSKSGEKEQIVRILPDSVENPNSVGQILQRMKVKPAAKFYAALETILSNAFEGVAYGEASRRYFMKKAMEMVGGPYIPKGVDRFIPAEYLMSEGSLPSFPLVRSQASDLNLHTSLTVAYEGGGTYTQQALADALGVSVNTQISIVIVNNENGVFVPHYAGFDERITIADLPSAALVINDQPQYGNAAIQVANLGIAGLTMTNWVAACVILSIQDASGAWLRSTQNMVLNTQMYADLYSTDAQNAAIASYQDTVANNALTNPWYLNLGMNQAFNGRIIVGVPSDMPLPVENAFARNCVIGEQVNEGDGYISIERCVFATDTTDNGLIIIVDGSVAKTDPALTVAAYRAALGENAFPVKTWLNSYAAQAGLTWQGGATPAPIPVNGKAQLFADANCTGYVEASSKSPMYLRVNEEITEDLTLGEGTTVEFVKDEAQWLVIVNRDFNAVDGTLTSATIAAGTIIPVGWAGSLEPSDHEYGSDVHIWE